MMQNPDHSLFHHACSPRASSVITRTTADTYIMLRSVKDEENNDGKVHPMLKHTKTQVVVHKMNGHKWHGMA